MINTISALTVLYYKTLDIALIPTKTALTKFWTLYTYP